jgi:hypothetical protein
MMRSAGIFVVDSLGEFRGCRRRKLLLSSLAALGLAFPAVSMAQNEWLLPGGGSYENPLNWSYGLEYYQNGIAGAGGTPSWFFGGTTDANFATGGNTYTVSFSGNEKAAAAAFTGASVTVAGDNVTLALNGHYWNTSGSIVVGTGADSSRSVLTVENGSLNSASFLGAIGTGITGTLNVVNGGVVTAVQGDISGTVNVSSSGVLTDSNPLYVENGTLNSAGNVTAEELGVYGAEMNVTGGTVNLTRTGGTPLDVEDDGNGTPSLIQQSGGTVNAVGVDLESSGFGEGIATPGCTYTISGGTLNCGSNGIEIGLDSGSTFLQTGGAVNVGALVVDQPSSVPLHYTATYNMTGGTLAVGGSGSGWNSGAIILGATNLSSGGPDSGVFLQSGGAVTAGSLTMRTGCSYNMSGGSATFGTITPNGGQFFYTGGNLSLTNSSLTVDNGGLLGPTLSLGSNQSLNVSGGVTVGSAGSLSINGGTLTTPSISNVAGGNFAFNSGTLNLTGSSLTVGAGGLLGNSVSLGSTKSLTISGTTAIGSGGSLALSGGSLTTSSIANTGGSFTYSSGALTLTNSGLSVGVGGLLGNALNLTSGKSVSVSGTASLAAGSSVTVNGGGFSAGSIDTSGGGTFNYLAGQLSLTGSNLSVSDSGLIGSFVNLRAGSSLNVSGTTTLASDAVFIVNGGTFITGSFDNSAGGTFAFTKGTVEVLNDPNFVTQYVLGETGTLNTGQVVTTTGNLTPPTTATNITGGSLGVSGTLSLGSTQSLTVNNAGSVSAATVSSSGSVAVAASASITATNAVTVNTGGALTNNGTVTAPSVTVSAGATASGSGTYNGNLTNNGTVSVGSNDGLDTVNGTYTQTGTLVFHLGGSTPVTGYDQMDVSGSATLSGQVDVTLIDLTGGSNLFNPPAGSSYDVLTASEIVNDGYSLSLPMLRGGDYFVASTVDNGSSQSLVLTVDSSSVPEPGVLTLLASGAIGLLSRRRRCRAC